LFVQVTLDTTVYGGKISVAEHIIATTTEGHSIEIVDGQLTIFGEDKTLTPDETAQLLDTLLIWRYGLEAVSLDEVEG
jgi:hypothetical protein